MSQPACEACKFFAKTGFQVGECRRRSPQVVAAKQGIAAVFPSVRTDHWCGEHQPSLLTESSES